MGVPKFFRSLNERYPCLSELVKEFQIPDFDNFYLDMNGIIHVCSHPNDFDPYFSVTEEKIFASIFHYIEVLFNLIKPRKLLFMAVDGVAPRAKINQQRARRFRAAKEAEIKDKLALKKGEKPLPKDRFDSNCITPGTVFMEHLHSQLQYFISKKISSDPLWQSCKIILSGHQTPGEGEHKIMEYIRYLKTLPDYDDNTKHCLYGLDADLIMLGMCTHEPHFSLLREKVWLSKQQSKKITSPDETEFYLLHLSLLREYLDLEFQELRESLTFQYNLENIIDDWVLMGFLVGNDFIPNLPDFHINKGAFPILFKAYKEVLPTLDGYLNENGYLNLPRFQKYLEKMADHDLESFEDTYANLAFLEEKTGKNFLSEEVENGEIGKKSRLEELIKATNESLGISDEEYLDEELDEYDENDIILWEFSQHKKNYYTNKLDYAKVTPEVLASQAEGYVRAIQWNLHYYYQGCQSWSWFYPHHYAPFISDIKNFKDFKLDFEMGKPFLPFEQLLAVLPPASKDLLPKAYHDLMTSPQSPIKDFYPEDFETDLNGKKQDWEAIVLIPFIDEKRLLEAMIPYNDQLTPEEKRRNKPGPMHIFTFTKDNLGVYKSLKYFPNITRNHALMKDVFREEILVKISDIKYGLRPGVLLDVLYPGFPTLKHISHTASLKQAKVKVFDYPSKEYSMILTLNAQKCPLLEVIAKNLLGKIIYINWPHLVESRAVAVSNREMKYYLTEKASINCEVFDKQKQLQWLGESGDLIRHYGEKLGIELGPVEAIVHVLTLVGEKCTFDSKGEVKIKKIWCTTPSACAFQVIVQDCPVQGRRSCRFNDMAEAFSVNSVVFMLGQPHFGSMGRVLDNKECFKNGRLKVELEVVNDLVINESLLKFEPKITYLPCKTALKENEVLCRARFIHRTGEKVLKLLEFNVTSDACVLAIAGKVAALKVGISPHLLSRITGSVWVSMTNKKSLNDPSSKVNIGLNLKFFKKNQEIPGYTKRENDNWLYSKRTVAVVAAYVKNFPRVVEYLSNHKNTNVFFVQDIFPGAEGITEMKEVVAWIKAQEFNQIDRLNCGASVLDSAVVSKIEKIVDLSPKKRFTRLMQIKPHLLYKSELVLGNAPPSQSATHNLLDRVVSVRSSFTVPTGLRGFIIGIHPAPLDADYIYDVLFDEPFFGGMKLNTTSERVFKLCGASFLNISDADRQRHKSGPSLGSINACLRPYYDESKKSAFAQWSHQPYMQDKNDEEFRKMWLNLQTVKPQEDALKKLLKIEKKEIEEIKDPVKSFFENASKVSMENTKTSARFEPAEPKNRFYLQLFTYYQSLGLGQPRFSYFPVGGKVMAKVFLHGGKEYSGLLCDDKESACESASLQALGALGEIPFHNVTHMQKEIKDTKTTKSHMKPPNDTMKSKNANLNRPLLPDPPSQWVGFNKSSQFQKFSFSPSKGNCHLTQKMDGPDQIKQNSANVGSKKLNASALEFIPLQTITGKRNLGKIATIPSTKQVPEPQKKTEVVATLTNNNAGTSSSKAKPKRRPKIAAKLNLDPNLY